MATKIGDSVCLLQQKCGEAVVACLTELGLRKPGLTDSIPCELCSLGKKALASHSPVLYQTCRVPIECQAQCQILGTKHD